jgi:hypothetical protein
MTLWHSSATWANEGSAYARRLRSSGSLSLGLSVLQTGGRAQLSTLLHGTCIGVAGLLHLDETSD